MEVPSEVLQKLVCERCSGYLSRGPVHLMENTKYRCGRCPWTEGDEEEGIRVEAYEELAKLMSFPCRYRENGCTSKVPFTDNERHEQACPYRESLCPFAESGQCEWTGLHKGILKHCQQDHPTKVVENPCKFTYDITWPSLNNYILFAFEVLFLIQSKVCTATRKIYHAVRLIDDPARAFDFKYKLVIQNKDKLFITPGDVLPRELLVLQEDTSVVTGINGLLGMLGDFKDSTFTVTIECSSQGTSSSNTPDHVTAPVKASEVTVSCDVCLAATKPVYRGGWMCKEHAPRQRMCLNRTKGCTYSDIIVKGKKHGSFFCQYIHECSICTETITGTTPDSHYTQAHSDIDITHRVGTVSTLKSVSQWFIFDCDFGRTVCSCEMFNFKFMLSMCTPLPNAQLYKYRCTVELSHPVTGHTFTRTPEVMYSRREDWFMCIPQSDCDAYIYDNKMNIKINITKLDDPSQFMV